MTTSFDDCAFDECQRLGYCKDHGIFLERRKDQEVINKQVADLVQSLSTIRGIILGFSALALIILSGSYLYTKDMAARSFSYTKIVADRSEKADDIFLTRQLGMLDAIGKLYSVSAIAEERNTQLVKQIAELNKTISEDMRTRHK